ncbi:hypothetical protein HDU96_003856, partial [Phlyctochytrium bullatum]
KGTTDMIDVDLEQGIHPTHTTEKASQSSSIPSSNPSEPQPSEPLAAELEDIRWLYAMTASFFVGIMAMALQSFPGLCLKQDGAFQLHAVWHVFAALGVYYGYFYCANEPLHAPSAVMSTAPRWTPSATRTLLTHVATHLYADPANPRTISRDLPWSRFVNLVNDRHDTSYTPVEVRDRVSHLQRWWLDQGAPPRDGSMRVFWDMMELVFSEDGEPAGKRAVKEEGDGNGRLGERGEPRNDRSPELCEPWGGNGRSAERGDPRGGSPERGVPQGGNDQNSSVMSDHDNEDEGSGRVWGRKYRRWTEAMCIDLLRFHKSKGSYESWDPFLDKFNRTHNETMNAKLAAMKVFDLRRTYQTYDERPLRISQELWDAMVAAFSETGEGEMEDEVEGVEGELPEPDSLWDESEEDSSAVSESQEQGPSTQDRWKKRWTDAMCIDLLKIQQAKRADGLWRPFLDEFNRKHNETITPKIAGMKVFDLRKKYANYK